MTAELVAHRREDAVREVRCASRRETLGEGDAQHRSRYALVDRSRERPAPLARIGDTPREASEVWAVEKRRGGEIEQPRGDHAAPAPQLGNLREVELVLVVLGFA